MADAKKEDKKSIGIDLISSPPPFFNLRMTLGHYLFPRSRGFRTRKTSIPVPKVQRAWCSNGITYILMDVVRGVELAYAWHNMSQDTKDWAVGQLRDYIAQLRALDPPSSSDGAVTSVIGGPLRDGSRIGLEQFGPFGDHDDFHQFLRAGITVDSFGAFHGADEVLVSHRQQYATKFTHGDLAPRNIMVMEDGTITAIIDWDSAGWFPEYWEYTKANFTPQVPDDWVSRIGEITGRYDEQLAGDRRLCTLCGYMLT